MSLTLKQLFLDIEENELINCKPLVRRLLDEVTDELINFGSGNA